MLVLAVAVNPECDNCEAAIPMPAWVVLDKADGVFGMIDGESAVVVFVFCSEECRDGFVANRDS